MKKSIGIDIGLNSVKMVELTKDARGTIRLSKATIRYASFEWDVYQEKRDEELAGFIKRARETDNVKSGKPIIVSLPCLSTFVRYIHILETKRKKETELIEYEAQQQIPLSLDEVAWDYNILGESAEGGKHAMLVAVKKEMVDDTVEIVKKGGFHAATVSLSLFCLLNLVRQSALAEDLEGFIIIDIGAESTGIMISRGRHMWFRNINVAGKKISQNIIQNAGIDYAQAEAIKRMGPKALTELDSATQDKVKETISFDLGNFVTEIERSLAFYRSEYANVDESLTDDIFKQFRIILTGGGSKLDGLPAFIEKRLEMRVSHLRDFIDVKVEKSVLRKTHLEGIGAEEDIEKEVVPLLAVAMGAALNGLGEADCGINFLAKEIEEQHMLQAAQYLRTISYLFFISALIINIVGQVLEVRTYTKHLREVGRLSDQMDTYAPQLTTVQEKIAETQYENTFLQQYITKRFLWLESLNLVAGLLPRDVWITHFQCTGTFMPSESNHIVMTGMTLSHDRFSEFSRRLKEESRVTESKVDSFTQSDQEGRFNFLINVTVD